MAQSGRRQSDESCLPRKAGVQTSYDIITKEHNATIKAESKEGGGAKFTISLPLNQTNDF